MRQRLLGDGIRWPRLPLRSHLFALALAPLIPLLLFSLALFAAFDEQHRQHLELALEEKAIQLTRALDAELDRSVGSLHVAGTSAALASGELQRFHARARQILSAEPTWSNLLVFGPAGEHLLNARVPYGTRLPELARPDLVVRAAQTRMPVVSDMVQPKVVTQQLITVYVPIVDGASVKYVIAAAIEPANWRRLLLSRMAPDMYSVVLDATDTVIATTAEQDTRDAVAAPGQRLEFGHRDFSRVARQMLGGRVDAYVAARSLPRTGWTVAAYMPARLFDTVFWRSTGALGAAFVVLLMLALWLSASLGRSIARSIGSLVSCVDAVAARRVPPSLDDRITEVGAARQSLVAAASSLSEHLQHEERAHAQLEDQERARNAFLAMLGHELRIRLHRSAMRCNSSRGRSRPDNRLLARWPFSIARPRSLSAWWTISSTSRELPGARSSCARKR